MKIAITAAGDKLDSAVDPRFGRCAYLVVVDSETKEIVGSGRNEFAAASGGAGPQVAQWTVDLGAEIVLTGNLGPNAFNALKAGNIRCVTGVAGTVLEAVEAFESNNLQETNSSTVPSHSGMKN